jgi:hypothetical protein
MIRWAISAVLLVLMAAFGVGVYQYLDSQKRLHTRVQQPTSITATALPGTMYLAQAGILYRFEHGRFTKLTTAEGWTQPALSGDGSRLVAVKRTGNFSDLYLLDTTGRVLEQVTHNASGTVERNHWAFYPRFSADGQSVYYSYDPKDPGNSFRLDLAIYAQALGSRAAPREWSYPYYYTGGDVSPVPLKSGALLYSKFSIDANGKVHSQLWIQARAGSAGAALTEPDADCGQPSVSPSEAQVAMICRHGNLTGDLEVAALNASAYSLGAPVVLVPAGLAASPVFSPDGATLAYFAPGGSGGAFQLWTVGIAAATTPSPAPVQPRQVTHELAFDTSAAPAWA